MKILIIETLLSKIKEEYMFQHSEFMEKIILLDKSIFKYYKKYYNRNIFFHPFKFFKYLKIKRFLKKEEYQEYIDIYQNKNLGWFKSNLIPKNRKNRKLEIINYFGKKIEIELNDYGFHYLDDLTVEFGWICWVKYWRFLDNKSRKVEEVKL